MNRSPLPHPPPPPRSHELGRRPAWLRTLALALALALLGSLAAVPSLHADITVRLSVKFILDPNGNYPSGGIGTNNLFQVEVDRGNGVLAATGRGYRLQVIEYLPIQPPVPAGKSADYWFTNSARASRQEVESASIANPVAWRRNLNGALNIYVNNSSSGQCSFLGNGDSITLGTSISAGTVLHEIGHFFNLSHTHAGDPSCSTFVPPNPLSAALGNGDGLAETPPDHPCYNRDQLSLANFGAVYALLNANQQATIDNTWLNVMSYHQEDRLLDIQMDFWTAVANRGRQTVCTGRTWFVSTDGVDLYPFGWDGLEPGLAFRTPEYALTYPFPDIVRSPDDVILIRAGTYDAPQFITTTCTLRATRGTVTLQR